MNAASVSDAGRLSLPSFWQRLPRSGRLFFQFWGGVSIVALLGAITLQELSALRRSGAPAVVPPAAGAKATDTRKVSDASHQEVARSSPPEVAIAPPPPGVHAIPAPLPALMEAAPDEPGHSLPKIGADGSLPRKVYAAEAPSVPAGNARIAILLDGFGLSEDMSRTAVQDLPSTVSFAIPAYAPPREDLLSGARQSGHEIFLALPMQPSTAPLDDEGPKALGYDHSSAADRKNLEWALSRLNGYVGVTNAFSGLDGDAYAQSPDFRMVSKELDARGLSYLNATPGTSWIGPVVGANAALTFDTSADSAGVDGQLAHLVEMAKSSGSAIGVAGPMRPVLLQRIVEWSRGLAGKGVTLVPVSSLSADPAPISGPSDSVRPVHIESSAPPLVPAPAAVVGQPFHGPSSVTAVPLAAPSPSVFQPSAASPTEGAKAPVAQH